MARIVVAGSRDVDSAAAYHLAQKLTRLGASTIIMRRGRETEPGPLEIGMAELARTAGWNIEWRVPAPGGRMEVFYRDVDMVSKADLVIAVFSRRRAMEGGTGHVVEKAIDHRVAAYAYTFDGTDLERIGEYDPDDTWSRALGD